MGLLLGISHPSTELETNEAAMRARACVCVMIELKRMWRFGRPCNVYHVSDQILHPYGENAIDAE